MKKDKSDNDDTSDDSKNKIKEKKQKDSKKRNKKGDVQLLNNLDGFLDLDSGFSFESICKFIISYLFNLLIIIFIYYFLFIIIDGDIELGVSKQNVEKFTSDTMPLKMSLSTDNLCQLLDLGMLFLYHIYIYIIVTVLLSCY
jgi:hypothetical protein